MHMKKHDIEKIYQAPSLADLASNSILLLSDISLPAFYGNYFFSCILNERRTYKKLSQKYDIIYDGFKRMFRILVKCM